MTRQNLKLVKSNKTRQQVKVEQAKKPALTPDEANEAARFKAIIAAKAARQAMIHQIMAELDQTSTAA